MILKKKERIRMYCDICKRRLLWITKTSKLYGICNNCGQEQMNIKEEVKT